MTHHFPAFLFVALRFLGGREDTLYAGEVLRLRDLLRGLELRDSVPDETALDSGEMTSTGSRDEGDGLSLSYRSWGLLLR